IEEKKFQIVEVQYGPFSRPEILPLIGDAALGLDKVAALVDEGKIKKDEHKKIKEDHVILSEKMEVFLAESRDVERELVDRISALEKNTIFPIVKVCLDEARKNHKNKKMHIFLDGLHEYIMEDLDIFKEPENTDDGKSEPDTDRFIAFEVNVIVENSRSTEAPVVIETTPSYSNIFGTIERVIDSRGEHKADFTNIRAGSILRANGGYLVLNLQDLLYDPAVWPALKRTLKNQEVTIQTIDSYLMIPVSALKPEPIDIDVKVVVIGDAYSYQVLYNYDEDFKKIFKVKADFDNVMENSEDNLGKYAQFIRQICEAEQLFPFHKTGVAAIIEEGVRAAGRRNKISTQFSEIADVIREAHYWASKDEAELVTNGHVDKAKTERMKRINLIEDKLQEMIENGTILLDIDGHKIGQVNGLSVYDLGDYAFGKPTRITAEAAMGRAGVINIEREADLSGKTHNKGVLIIEGFLRKRYAQDKPMTMSASICFEQSYSGIDGDSASSTEIYALLSSLAEVPLRQDLAVTGSVNQKGEIQPIGGVNEKIEGFFDICSAKGLTGRQGVVIPALNKDDLMLRKDVVDAVAAGKFHIYAIKTIDQGVELLTGKKAGDRLADGTYKEGSINALVDDKLHAYADSLRDYLDADEGKE
ncbi:MAG: Lon protease family protein, partial [Candidatus Latescibacterota bacterium]